MEVPSYVERNPGNKLARQIIRLMRENFDGYFLTHVDKQEFARIEMIARTEAVRNAARMLRGAEIARSQADSWRNFNVGVAGMAVYFNPTTKAWRYELVHGANAKPIDGDDTINVHAEHTMMTTVLECTRPGEISSIPFAALVGDVQPDQQTGLASTTLHPCGVCREAFAEPITPIDSTTMFLSATKDMKHFEWYTVDALNHFHDSGNTSEIGAVSFDEPPLALTFDPESLMVDGVVDMTVLEDERFIQSDSEVADKLIVPLMNYSSTIR